MLVIMVGGCYAVPMTETLIFKTDAGATYVCSKDAGLWTFQGDKVRLAHTSEKNDLRYTGKVRNQGTMRGAFKFSVGMGRRAVMTFDTGHDVQTFGGVVLTRNVYN